MNPFTLTCNHSSWPEGVSLEDKMNMTQPTKLKFSTTGDGTFWASFVGKVMTAQSKQASEVVAKKRQKKMDEPAANVSSVRYVSWDMKSDVTIIHAKRCQIVRIIETIDPSINEASSWCLPFVIDFS